MKAINAKKKKLFRLFRCYHFLACSAGVFVASEPSIFLLDGKCVANILKKVGERKKFRLPRRW